MYCWRNSTKRGMNEATHFDSRLLCGKKDFQRCEMNKLKMPIFKEIKYFMCSRTTICTFSGLY